MAWVHDDFMELRRRRRLGLGIMAAALIGLAAYMLAAGWYQSGLIATVGSFFVGIVGLAVMAMPVSTSQGGRVRSRTVMRDVTGAGVQQDITTPSAAQVLLEMTRVISRDKPVQQQVHVADQQPARNGQRPRAQDG
jgi:hypothetical protein